jgi:hypothetical protein
MAMDWISYRRARMLVGLAVHGVIVVDATRVTDILSRDR